MIKLSILLLVFLSFLVLNPFLGEVLGQRKERLVIAVEVRDFISQATSQHVADAVQEASSGRYVAILLLLDTLGGSLDATFKIIEVLSSSQVPVIGFVYPAGGQALSAGTYILMASDYAAMAPSTTIGSAQPVSGSTPIEEPKIINAMVAKMTTLASLHGRNATQAERFVTKNDNLSADMALRIRVIEATASSPVELLSKAHGASVNTTRGIVILDTLDAGIVEFHPSVTVRVQQILSDPIVSGILLTIGFLAVILGLTTPGFGAEVAGGIMIILGLLGQGFNVNLAALLLMIIGSGLLVFELHAPGFGAFGAGGIIVLAIGTSLLISQPPQPLLVSPPYSGTLIAYSAIILAVIGSFFGFLIYKAARAVRIKRRYVGSVLVEVGKAVDDIDEEGTGFVQVAGEYWKAKSSKPIKKGASIKVAGKEGSVLVVEESKGERRE